MQKSVGTIIGIIVIVAIGLYRNIPSWDEVDSKTVRLTDDQAYTIQLEMKRSAKVKVTANENNGKTIVAYWVNPEDHQAIQSGTVDESIFTTVGNQLFFSDSSSGEGEATVPSGDVYVYVECSDGGESDITYSVSIYQ